MNILYIIKNHTFLLWNSLFKWMKILWFFVSVSEIPTNTDTLKIPNNIIVIAQPLTFIMHV